MKLEKVHMRVAIIAALLRLILTGCGEIAAEKNMINIESAAFKAGNVIPKENTGEGADLSPALSWSGVPAAAKELALICDDPDAPRKDPWVHWVIYRIPAGAAGLPADLPKEKVLSDPKGALQGANDFGKTGYNGPMPPKGHGTHHYHFKLYALDAPLNLGAEATKAKLLEAMKGHIIAQGEIIGTYERKY